MDFLIGIHSNGIEKHSLSVDSSNVIDSYRLYVDGFKILSLPEFTFHDIWFDFKDVDDASRLAYMSYLQETRGFDFVNCLRFDGRYYLEDICGEREKNIEIEEGRVTVIHNPKYPEYSFYFPIFSDDKLAVDLNGKSVGSRLMCITLLNVGDSKVNSFTITYGIKNCINSHSLYNMEIVIDLKSLDCGITIDNEYVYGDKHTVDLLYGSGKHNYSGRPRNYSFFIGGDKSVCPVKLEDLIPVEYSDGKLLIAGNTAILTLEVDDLSDNFILQSNITDVIIRFDGSNIKYNPITIVFPPSVSNITFISSPNIHKTNDFVTFMLSRTANLPNILKEIYENEISEAFYGSKLNKHSVLNSILSTFDVDYRTSLNLLDNNLDKFIKIMKALRIKVEFYG